MKLTVAVLACVALMGALSPAAAARDLKQVAGQTSGLTYGTDVYRPSVIDSGYSGTSSVGTIETGDTQGSQAALYARGVARSTGLAALGQAVAFEDEGGAGGAHAAGDAIRRQAGYQGSSIAGDFFSAESSGSDSPAEAAIRRTQADNALLQQRISAANNRYSSANPYNI